MGEYMNVLILGGDKRQKILCEMLNSYGFNAEHYYTKSDFSNDFGSFEAVILPYPATKDKVTLFNTLSADKITLEEIDRKVTTQKVLTGGKTNIKNSADYASCEMLTTLNAVPTAEAALAIAISETDITLQNSNCLVIGGGKIGKMLSRMLKSLGAKVTVAARKESDLALTEALGMVPLKTSELNAHTGDFDIIFNTVPAQVISTEGLKNCKEDVLLIELASHPYGFDMDAAKGLGLKALPAPALPGKFAPKTAAQILCKVIIPLLS